METGPQSSGRDAHEAIVELLDRAGVGAVFTLMSEEVIPLRAALADRAEAFDVVDARHEQGAAAMADGYARVSGDVGVCVVGRGPAIAQTGTALVAARKNGSRVLYLVPESARDAAYDGKRFEQEAYLRSTVGEVVSAGAPDLLLPTLADALRRLRAGEGPIAVQVPKDVLAGTVPDDGVLSRVGDRGTASGPSRIHPDPAAVDAVVDRYLDSDATRAPVLLAGRGAVAAGAGDAIERLAERMGAYLATTARALGTFADHPYSLGFAGDLGTHVAAEYVGESDFVVAFGASLNPHTLDGGRLLREEATLVQVDADPAAVGRHTPVDVGVVGDARATAEALEDALAALDVDRADQFWTDRVREHVAGSSPVSDRSFPSAPDRIDPRDLVRTLDDALPDDRVVVSDAGHFCGWFFDGLTIDRTDAHLWTVDFVAIGQGLPVGLGAAVAEDRRAVVTVCGDAGLMMALPELETAARQDLPTIVVVVNDDALGAEYHQAEAMGYSGTPAVVGAPEFADVARDLGAEGHVVRSTADVDELADVLAGDIDGPVVVDCKVNLEARHRSVDAVVDG